MMKVFGVYDLKAAAYGQPLFFLTKGIALRAFSDACCNPKSVFAEHPGDYVLHELGTYDEASGKLESLKVPEFVASASSVIDQVISARRNPGVAAADAIEAAKKEIGQVEKLVLE